VNVPTTIVDAFTARFSIVLGMASRNSVALTHATDAVGKADLQPAISALHKSTTPRTREYRAIASASHLRQPAQDNAECGNAGDDTD
jgi:hypothetical protein